MVTQAQVPNQTIVLEHVFAKLLHARDVFEMDVCLKQTPIELDDLTQCQMLSWCFVQPPDSLNELWKH
jgi:hypothetical protein